MTGTAGAAREDPPATAAEAWSALQDGGLRTPESRAVIASYLAPGPAPRYDTPSARAEAEHEMEAGQ
jgi:hypothetical protein